MGLNYALFISSGLLVQGVWQDQAQVRGSFVTTSYKLTFGPSCIHKTMSACSCAFCWALRALVNSSPHCTLRRSREKSYCWTERRETINDDMVEGGNRLTKHT
ncbi:hypothetical protein Z043_114198 [Scleropages formosus]|uniref:Secreted protein n=1 Tax=Scleropages formosus TaxID=113540 RepID=A0A0P7YIN0_SCLFO|nr:hypothetical protein Z043_114198 [Scleropages formosus]